MRPGYNSNARNSYNKTNTCTACGNMSCSGKWETCDASDKKCYKCERIGHYSRQCRSIRNIRGEIIRQKGREPIFRRLSKSEHSGKSPRVNLITPMDKN